MDRAAGPARIAVHHAGRGGGGVAVTKVHGSRLTNADAAAGGFPSKEALLKWTSAKGTGTLYRIDLRLAGPDPRIALRDAADLGDAELERPGRQARPDGSRRTATLDPAVLRQISQRPAVVSTELAAAAGLPRDYYKIRVRRLKALGLTESLEIGYRLSPRGAAYLLWLDAHAG